MSEDGAMLRSLFERERAEHITDVAIAERRLIRCEQERDKARAERDEIRAMHSQMCRVSAGHCVARDRARAALATLLSVVEQYEAESIGYEAVAEAKAAARRLLDEGEGEGQS